MLFVIAVIAHLVAICLTVILSPHEVIRANMLAWNCSLHMQKFSKVTINSGFVSVHLLNISPIFILLLVLFWFQQTPCRIHTLKLLNAAHRLLTNCLFVALFIYLF